MSKVKPEESVLQDWVHKLPFQQQALLLTAMRGPDNMSKHCLAKIIVRYLRGHVIKPAGNWKGKNDNDFMWGELEMFEDYISSFWHSHDEYPHHFIMHLFHSAEVIGYCHPDEKIREFWNLFYNLGCKSFHLREETKDDMNDRLNDFGCGYKPGKSKRPVTKITKEMFLERGWIVDTYQAGDCVTFIHKKYSFDKHEFCIEAHCRLVEKYLKLQLSYKSGNEQVVFEGYIGREEDIDFLFWACFNYLS